MPITGASVSWMPGPAEEAEDAQGCKPGTDTAARAGPTSSSTRMLVPRQLPSKARSAGGHGGLAWEQGQHCCWCSTGTPCQGTACTRPPEQHGFYARGGQGWWGPGLGHRTRLDSASPCDLGGQTHPRTAAPGPSIALLQHIGFSSTPPAVAGLWASPLGAASSTGAVTTSARHQDVPTPTGTCFCHERPLHGNPLCRTEEPGHVSFCLWPGQGLVVLCFCSCCKLTAKVSLYTEYLQILIYICISFCYSIFICSGSTNDVFFLFTDATGQENDGGFVWPVGFVCVTVEDAGLY